EIQHQDIAGELYEASVETAFSSYRSLIELGVCREQARAILPSCFYTGFVWTVSYQALINFLSLRRETSAQYEIQCYSRAIEKLIEPIVPHSFSQVLNIF
ncbi:MAG: FAD-dependent thymidylate synthase, partial [Waterburya sp.]